MSNSDAVIDIEDSHSRNITEIGDQIPEISSTATSPSTGIDIDDEIAKFQITTTSPSTVTQSDDEIRQTPIANTYPSSVIDIDDEIIAIPSTSTAGRAESPTDEHSGGEKIRHFVNKIADTNCIHYKKESSVKIHGGPPCIRQAEGDAGSREFSESSHAEESPETEERASWGRKAEFICSCLGYAVGLGNLWRFPYLCYTNGGGAFLLPYGIMLVFVGIPVFFIELTIGQYASQGCVGVWKCCPLFKGLGYGMVSLSALISIYYNVIMCWAVFYLFATFSDLPSLPWVGCNHIWNTENCYDDRDINATLPGNDTNITVASASEEYFSIYVLKESSGIDDTGSLRWHLTLCLLLAWTLGFLALVRGVKSIGKVVYFTAIFPYVVLIILFFRGVTLPGAGEGIKFYMKADWSVLWNARVWKDAAAQIFFSLSAANGGLHVVSSYNKFSNNVYMDAMIIPLLNCGTSIFAGFAIFSTLGFMAHETGKDVSEVAASGVGLAFIAYPEALSRMPGAPFWAFLFFIMLITLGLGSLLVLVETIVTSIRDEFPIVNKWIKGHTWLLPFVICLVLFILGLPHVTEAGLYWLALQDAYAAAISMLILGLTELIVITYIYGYRNLLRNLKDMIGERTRTFNYILYGITVIPMFIAPFLVVFVLIYYIYDYKPLEVGAYTYPYWAEPILGWLMTFGSIGMIVLYMPYHLIFNEKGSFIVRLKNSLKPRKDWGPLKEENRTMQNTHHGEEIIECVDDMPSSYRLPQVNPSDEVPEVIVHSDGLVVNHCEQSTLKGKNAANEDSDPDTETNV